MLVERPLPRRGAAGGGAQGAHTEPVDEHPVLLDARGAPAHGVVEPTPEVRRVVRVRGEEVDPPGGRVDIRRLRGDVPGVEDERRPVEPIGETLDRIVVPGPRIGR